MRRSADPLHGHALDARIVAGALGHRPAFHGAVQFRAEVVVQPAGPVLLDDEGAPSFIGPAAGGGFRSALEIAFVAVSLQGVRHGHAALRALPPGLPARSEEHMYEPPSPM